MFRSHHHKADFLFNFPWKKYIKHDSDFGNWLSKLIYFYKHHDDNNEQHDHTPREYRTIDGEGNNETNIQWGSTHEWFLRKTPSDYSDSEGLYDPSGQSRPSAREVSNVLFAQTGNIPNSKGASDFLWVWGQFLDHDIDLTAGGGGPFHIEVPSGDPSFDPMGTGTAEIPLSRSGIADGTGPGTNTPGQQINEITAFIDASQVYGSDTERAEFIRDFDNPGKLKISAEGYLPYNTDGLPNAPGPMPNLFLAGDVRANENIILTSMHTLFAREHNRLVDWLAEKHPHWDGDKLYQEAKVLVEAELQSITYNEYLPVLLGPGALETYDAYDPDIDPSIANIFATAAFRFGHSQLSSLIHRLEENGETTADGNLELKDAFFRPDVLLSGGGIDPLLRGVAESVSQEIDLHLVDDIRNFLFGPPGSGGFDLGALNTQRGRDHGLPDYNTARKAYGLDEVEEFSDITSDEDIQMALQDLFGTVNNIDVFVGGLAEDHFPGALLGELFYTVLSDQFARIRDGDRFFYLDRLEEEEIDMIEDLSLSDIILLNSYVEHMQDNVFMAYDRMGGTDTWDTMEGTWGNDLMFGGEGKDKLHGYHGNDYLMGEEGKDKIKGYEGDDVLEGGLGKDYLWGGEGADIFRFSLHEQPNGKWKLEDGLKDKIYDFSVEEGDLLEFNIDFGETKPDLDEVATLRERGDTLHIKFEGGGHIVMYGIDGLSSLEEIATVDMV